MNHYVEVQPEKAYDLLTSGGVVWVCSKSKSGKYDLTPIAWVTPLDYTEKTSKVLFVTDSAHALYDNVTEQKSFVLALPTLRHENLLGLTGSISGKEVDKFEKFKIPSFKARKFDILMPQDVAGWVECKVTKLIPEGSVVVVMGEVLAAWAVPDAWKFRLHCISDGKFYTPSF